MSLPPKTGAVEVVLKCCLLSFALNKPVLVAVVEPNFPPPTAPFRKYIFDILRNWG